MQNEFFNLTVLTGILQDSLISSFAQYRNEDTPQNKANFLHELFEKNAENNFAKYVSLAVLYDDNAFSRACAANRNISSYLQKAYIRDLQEIGRALNFSSSEFEIGTPVSPIISWDDKSANLLYGYYQSSGFGRFISYAEFRYNPDLGLIPIQSPVDIKLDELKGYEREKAEVYDNLENFAKGLPCSDMLLYGDRGTGKSSTVHAMVDVFFSQKLRLVEISKENIIYLPALKDLLSKIPLRFLIFIDDFSLNEKDDRISSLKAALQGSGEHTENVMIVATSNRRHIVDESVSVRENSLHGYETEQELLSLSERFGCTILFSATGKQQYLQIVHELAKDKKIKCTTENLDMLAEKWAIVKGGRSPRRAKQLIGYLIACQKKGKEFTI